MTKWTREVTGTWLLWYCDKNAFDFEKITLSYCDFRITFFHSVSLMKELNDKPDALYFQHKEILKTPYKERNTCRHRARQGWIFLTHIHLYQLLAYVIESLVLSKVIFLHWGIFKWKILGPTASSEKQSFPSGLPTEIPHWSASFLFNKSQLMAKTSMTNRAQNIWTESVMLRASGHLQC